MNQKEFEIIGGVFYKEYLELNESNTGMNYDEYVQGQLDELKTIISLTASSLALNYPKTFDKDKFLKSCGL